MKLSTRIQEAEIKKQQEAARAKNIQTLTDIKEKLKISQPISNEVLNLVASYTIPFEAIRLISQREFDRRLMSVSAELHMEGSAGAIADKSTTNSDVLYLYSPEFEEIVAELEEKNARYANTSRLGAYFKKNGIFLDSKRKEVIANLPSTIPYTTYLEGQRERMITLANRSNTEIHGDVNSDFFAVEHMLKGEPVITFFVEEYDYRAVFAQKLVKYSRLTETQARQVSEELPHNIHYRIVVCEDTAKEYAMNMARLLKVEDEGAIIHDLLQGDIDVTRTERKWVLNIDDELPSSVLIGNVVNIFVP